MASDAPRSLAEQCSRDIAAPPPCTAMAGESSTSDARTPSRRAVRAIRAPCVIFSMRSEAELSALATAVWVARARSVADDAHLAQRGDFFFERPNALPGIDQFVRHRQRRHDGQALVADLAEFAAQTGDAGFKLSASRSRRVSCPSSQAMRYCRPLMVTLTWLMSDSPASITERMVSIATSRRSAISRLVALQRARRARACRRVRWRGASGRCPAPESARQAHLRRDRLSRRRSTALSSASSAAASRRVAASMSLVPASAAGSGLDETVGHAISHGGTTAIMCPAGSRIKLRTGKHLGG